MNTLFSITRAIKHILLKVYGQTLHEDLQGILRCGVRNVFQKLKTEQSFKKKNPVFFDVLLWA